MKILALILCLSVAGCGLVYDSVRAGLNSSAAALDATHQPIAVLCEAKPAKCADVRNAHDTARVAVEEAQALLEIYRVTGESLAELTRAVERSRAAVKTLAAMLRGS